MLAFATYFGMSVNYDKGCQIRWWLYGFHSKLVQDIVSVEISNQQQTKLQNGTVRPGGQFIIWYYILSKNVGIKEEPSAWRVQSWLISQIGAASKNNAKTDCDCGVTHWLSFRKGEMPWGKPSHICYWWWAATENKFNESKVQIVINPVNLYTYQTISSRPKLVRLVLVQS